MRNIAPSRVLSRRSNQLLTLAFVVAAVGIFVGAVGVFLYIVPLATPSNPQYGLYAFVRLTVLILAGVFFLIAIALAVRALTWKKDNDLAIVTGRFLEQYLDDGYTFIRNISKRQIGYVDAALIGPPGVLIFRILNNRGIFANEASNWLKQGKTASEWKPAGINPTREAIADIRKTRQFLAKNRLGETPVYGVVVFTVEPPYTQLMAKAPTVPITNLSLLYTNLQDNYLAQTRIDPAHVTAIVRLLFGD
jgi:hypothetical protein